MVAHMVDAAAMMMMMVCVWTGSATAQTEEIKTEFLEAHNAARANVPVRIPTLEWNATLASYARTYALTQDAEGRSCTGNLAHSDGNNGKYGENIYGSWATSSSSSSIYDATLAVQSWVSEAQNYTYETNSCVPDQMCGHYTQVVWNTTTDLGCYLLNCSTVPTGYAFATFAICSYYPPGNSNRKPY